jgi:rhamnosyltransferase
LKKVFVLSFSLSVIVPTRNPGDGWPKWLKAFGSAQPQVPCVVVDSSSNDGTDFSSSDLVTKLVTIDAACFNHGDTRNFAVQQLDKSSDVVVFMTQDALLANADALRNLQKAFTNPSVGCAFGRQLPHINANPLAAHARLFNYPETSRVVCLADKAQLGIKACFLSNSFAAYRVKDLLAVGGFPTNVILGEDMTVAAQMLMAGKSVAYVSDACVYHSHNYTLLEEFRRYFDTGVFHAQTPWLLNEFGAASGEGLRFVRSEFAYLWHKAPHFIPLALMRTLVKWMGYKLGRLNSHLPWSTRKWCSMHQAYWMQKKLRMCRAD